MNTEIKGTASDSQNQPSAFFGSAEKLESHRDSNLLEAEGTPNEKQMDAEFELDGKGRPISREVPDDD